MENWNDEITNKGWEEMKRLLDREMPVQPQPRRRAPLLLIGGLLSLILVAGLAAYRSYRIAGTGSSAVIAPSSGSSTPEEPVVEQIVPAASGQTDMADHSSDLATKPVAITDALTPIQPIPGLSTDHGNYDPRSLSYDESAINNPVSTSDQMPDSNTPHAVDVEAIPSMPIPLAEVALRALPTVSLLPSHINMLPLPALVHPISQRPLRWRLDISAGQGGWNQAWNMRLGTTMEGRMGNKWGWSAGLQWQYAHSFSKRNVLLPEYDYNSIAGHTIPDTVISADQVVYNPALDDFQVITSVANSPLTEQFDVAAFDPEDLIAVQNANGTTIAYIQHGQVFHLEEVHTLHSLHMPIHISFSPRSRWRIEGGLTPGYIVRARRSQLNADLSTAGGWQENTNTAISPRQAGLRNVDLTLDLGAEWQISSGISLYGTFRHGVLDYTLLKGGNRDYFRYLHIGTRIRL